MAFTLPIVRNYFPINGFPINGFPINDFIASIAKAHPDFIWPMKVNSVLI